MKTTWIHGGVVLLGAAAMLVAGCGGAQYQKAPAAAAPSAPMGGAESVTTVGAPSAPSTDTTRVAPSNAEDAQAAAAAPASRPSAASDASAGSDARAGAGGRQAALARDHADIDVAERILATAAGDCAAACRALGSMDRAAGHLCALAASSDERGRCDDARARVRAARERVLRTCGSCPGGPSLERNAPIPSR